MAQFSHFDVILFTKIYYGVIAWWFSPWQVALATSQYALYTIHVNTADASDL